MSMDDAVSLRLVLIISKFLHRFYVKSIFAEYPITFKIDDQVL